VDFSEKHSAAGEFLLRGIVITRRKDAIALAFPIILARRSECGAMKGDLSSGEGQVRDS